jgi:hypothetical protein
VILEQSGKDFTPHWVALQDTLTLWTVEEISDCLCNLERRVTSSSNK